MGNVSVIDSTVNNFGLPIVYRHLEHRIDRFTSLDFGTNGEDRYWVPGASNVFWKTALSQPFSVWQDQGIDRKTSFFSNGKGVMSAGTIKEMGKREPSWGNQAPKQ